MSDEQQGEREEKKKLMKEAWKEAPMDLMREEYAKIGRSVVKLIIIGVIGVAGYFILWRMGWTPPDGPAEAMSGLIGAGRRTAMAVRFHGRLSAVRHTETRTRRARRSHATDPAMASHRRSYRHEHDSMGKIAHRASI